MQCPTCGKRNDNITIGNFNGLVICRYCHQIYKTKADVAYHSDKFSTLSTLVNIYQHTMREKNNDFFHPNEPLHYLWLSFEYFHTRFIKKVGAETLDVGIDLATSAGIGFTLGGPHSAAVSLAGGATTKVLNTSITNISKKKIRDSEMQNSHQVLQSLPAPSIEAAKAIGFHFPESEQSVKYYAYVWPGYDRFRRKAISCEQDFERTLFNLSTRDSDFYLKNDIYYKPPKSGKINHSLLNYFFLVRNIFSASENYNDTFENLNLFWTLSKNWPMLDYLFFNYGFFKYFLDFQKTLPFRSALEAKKADEIVRSFFYTGRFYFLSKDFYLEHFFRVIIPTYEFVLRTCRKNNGSNTSGRMIDDFLDIIKHKKTVTVSTDQQNKSFLSNLKLFGGQIFHHSFPKQYAKDVLLNENYAIFFIFLEEFLRHLEHMDLDLRLNFLNVLVEQFLNYNSDHENQKYEADNLQQILREFHKCFDQVKQYDSGTTLNQRFCLNHDVDTNLRDFFQSCRNLSAEFLSSKEFEKLKCFIYKKLYTISHANNINKELIKAGCYKSIQKIITTLLSDGFDVFEKDFLQFNERNLSIYLMNSGISDGIIRTIAIAITATFFKNKIDSKTNKTIASALGCTRISAGTTNYLYSLLHGNSFVTEYFGRSISADIIRSAIIGPNIVSLFTDLAVQAGKQYFYQQMDKKCLSVVDRLVIPFSTSKNDSNFNFRLQSLGSPVRSYAMLQNADTNQSSMTLNESQQKDHLLCQIFVYLCLSRNIQTPNAEVQQMHPDPARHICFQFSDEFLFKKYINQAYVFAKEYALSHFQDTKIQKYTHVFLAVSECFFKFISLKKSAHVVFDRYDESPKDICTNAEYLNLLQKFFRIYDEFNLAINSLKIIIDDARGVLALPNTVQSKFAMDYPQMIERILVNKKHLEEKAKILFIRIEQYEKQVEDKSEKIKECETDNFGYAQQRASEEDYAYRLNLGFKLLKPFCLLSVDEKTILYRDFGRVFRHLFQNSPKPSEILSCEKKLKEILQQIKNLDHIDESKIKEFVKIYFEYSQIILSTEMFIYYSRVYQFLQERIRIEYLDVSKNYMENLSDHVNAPADQGYDTSIKQSVANIKELLKQLKQEYAFYFDVKPYNILKASNN